MRAFLSRFRVWIAALLAGTAATGAGMMALTQGTGTVDVFVGSTPTPVATPTATPTPTGNLWVETSAGACTRSSSAVSYAASSSPDARCGSLDTAFQAATNGDTVRVRAGTYGDQQVLPRTGSTGAGVTFTPDAGATPDFGLLNFEGADYWTFNGPATIDRADLTGNINGTLDDVTIAFGYADQTHEVLSIVANGSGNSSGVTVSDSDISGAYDKRNVFIDDNGGTIADVTLSNNDIHSQRQSTDAIHMECVWVTDVDGLLMTGNRLWGCHGTGSMIISTSGGQHLNQDIRIEQNVFETAYSTGTDECCSAVAYTIQQNDAGDAADVVAYNLFESEAIFVAASGASIVGNLGVIKSCVSGVTYAKNTSTNSACSGDNAQDASALSSGRFVDAAGHDWRPLSGSVAQVNAGHSTCLAAGLSVCADPFGVTRPVGAAVDVGPYEWSG